MVGTEVAAAALDDDEREVPWNSLSISRSPPPKVAPPAALLEGLPLPKEESCCLELEGSYPPPPVAVGRDDAGVDVVLYFGSRTNSFLSCDVSFLLELPPKRLSMKSEDGLARDLEAAAAAGFLSSKAERMSSSSSLNLSEAPFLLLLVALEGRPPDLGTSKLDIFEGEEGPAADGGNLFEAEAPVLLPSPRPNNWLRSFFDPCVCGLKSHPY